MATNVIQDSTLSPNEFVLCLLLRTSLALSPCKFAACMRVLIPSTVPTGIAQHGSWLKEPALHTSRGARQAEGL